jgi:hypothetical protein
MTDLIDLDCYKEYKNIKSTDRDGKLQSLITQISALVENYCNRKFITYSNAQTAKVEWHDGKTNLVYLNEFPVISVTSVTTSDDGGVTTTTLTEGASDKTGYFVDLEEGTVFTQVSVNNFIDTYDVAYKSLEITYLAGYTVDTLPEDLKLAVQDLVHYYEENENVPSLGLGGATIDNAPPYTANSFPPQIRRVLDLYRYSPN